MSAKFTTNVIVDEVKLYDKGNNFIWSDDSTAEFQAALLSPDIQKKIENFKNKDINNSQIQRVLVLPVFELPQSGVLLVKFEIMPSY
jgi:hypothetical protein